MPKNRKAMAVEWQCVSLWLEEFIHDHSAKPSHPMCDALAAPADQMSGMFYRMMFVMPGAEYSSSCRWPLRRRYSIAEKSFLSSSMFFLNSFLQL